MNADRLTGWLTTHFGLGELRLRQITGGQSCPTFQVHWGAHTMALRKQPDGPILKGAHAVDREYRVLTALQDTDVPVPRPLRYEADATILGTPFYVMEWLDGRIFANYAMEGLNPNDRNALTLDMTATLARLHAIDPDQVGLSDFGRPGDYFARQIARWTKQWRSADIGPLPELDALIDWLSTHKPDDDGQSALTHGDFRPGNLLVHPTEPRVIGVLDWELSTLGHPLADLGFFAMGWHSAPDEYGGLLGLDRKALGMPDLDTVVAHYMAHTDRTSAFSKFHIAFAMFRFSVIFVGIAERAKSGSAAGANAEDLAPLARQFAKRGLALTA